MFSLFRFEVRFFYLVVDVGVRFWIPDWGWRPSYAVRWKRSRRDKRDEMHNMNYGNLDMAVTLRPQFMRPPQSPRSLWDKPHQHFTQTLFKYAKKTNQIKLWNSKIEFVFFREFKYLGLIWTKLSSWGSSWNLFIKLLTKMNVCTFPNLMAALRFRNCIPCRSRALAIVFAIYAFWCQKK